MTGEIPVAVLVAVIAVGGPIMAAAAAVLTAVLQARRSTRTDTHLLVDQLQEELADYRKTSDRRSADQGVRVTRLEERLEEERARADAYRSHAHALRAHIFDQKPPPPPTWPIDLPR
ncbi:MAG: hypothetical protein ACTH31_08525 [Pseudoclavibacter sp.]